MPAGVGALPDARGKLLLIRADATCCLVPVRVANKEMNIVFLTTTSLYNLRYHCALSLSYRPPCIPQLRKRRSSVDQTLLLPCRLRTPSASGWQTLLLLVMTTMTASVSVAIAAIATAPPIILTVQSHRLLFSSFFLLSSPFWLSCYHSHPA